MEEKQSIFSVFSNGIFKENPVFVLVLGMCPLLAVTTSAINGLGMGLAASFVLIMSNLIISLVRNFIPDKVRIPAFIVVIATFVTIVQFVMKGFFPALDKALGIFIPLIVVNCIILGRAEAFASKNNPIRAIIDGIGMGIGFTLALLLIGGVREVLGANKLFGYLVFPETFKPLVFMILPPGGFLTMGLLLMFFNWISHKRSITEAKKQIAAKE
ncbi:electron transport complex subunit E [Candidatus Dependentiae bacterium]|nr:electron transport complex subunit E [Candidatus Dependentiae bacterium]